jgi:hypothetical protein
VLLSGQRRRSLPHSECVVTAVWSLSPGMFGVNHPLGGPTSVCASLSCVHLGSGYDCLSSPLPTQVRPRECPPLRRDAYVTDGVAAVRRCGIGFGIGIGVDVVVVQGSRVGRN